MSKYRPNNAEVVDECAARLKALQAYVTGTSVTTIKVNGVAHSAAQVIEVYQDCLDARAKLATQRALAKASMVVREAAEQKRRATDRALKPWVINEFGAESNEALDFRFPPAKKAVRTVEEKANAVALTKATRKARHTKGKKQKKKIRGTIPVPTAPAEPAATVQAATPVASTPSTSVVTAPVNGDATLTNGAPSAH